MLAFWCTNLLSTAYTAYTHMHHARCVRVSSMHSHCVCSLYQLNFAEIKSISGIFFLSTLCLTFSILICLLSLYDSLPDFLLPHFATLRTTLIQLRLALSPTFVKFLRRQIAVSRSKKNMCPNVGIQNKRK